MSAENYEVFDADDVLFIFNVFFLGSHKDIDLVKGKLHVLLLRTDYLNCDKLFAFVIEGLHDFSERAISESFQKFIAVSNLLVLSP